MNVRLVYAPNNLPVTVLQGVIDSRIYNSLSTLNVLVGVVTFHVHNLPQLPQTPSDSARNYRYEQEWKLGKLYLGCL